MRRSRPTRFKARAFGLGTALIGICVVLLIVVKIVGLVQCRRFETEFAVTAAAFLDRGVVDVAAIASARTALRELSTSRGFEPETVRVSIERRAGSPGTGFIHVVAVEVHAEACSPAYDRPLARQLSAEELTTLAACGVHECQSCIQGRRHEHHAHAGY